MAGARKPPPPDLEAAWARFLVSREPEARTLLIEGYRRLVPSRVERMRSRFSAAMDAQDAMTWGYIALVEAVDRYKAMPGGSFIPFAVQRIDWAILNYIRSEMPVPLHLHEEIHVLEIAAQQAGLEEDGEDRLFELTLRATSRGVLSIEIRRDPGAPDIPLPLLDPAEAVDDQAIREAVASRLREAIESLGDPQATVLVQNMLLGRPLHEIGVELGLRRPRISQIKGEGLQRLTLILAGDRELLLGE